LRAKIQEFLQLRLGDARLAEAEHLSLEHTRIQILDVWASASHILMRAKREEKKRVVKLVSVEVAVSCEKSSSALKS
jgi:hypothetical protein